MELHCKEGSKAIGFEDSIRGIKSLLGANASAVLVNESGQYLFSNLSYLKQNEN